MNGTRKEHKAYKAFEKCKTRKCSKNLKKLLANQTAFEKKRDKQCSFKMESSNCDTKMYNKSLYKNYTIYILIVLIQCALKKIKFLETFVTQCSKNVIIRLISLLGSCS